MANVQDVAAYILSHFDKPITTMKLQKLVYYSQGWSLAWDEKPLFDSEIEAWANGPVVMDIFRNHRGQFSVSEWPTGDSSRLDPAEAETVDAVVDHYGKLTGQQLSDMTHSERPWIEAREGCRLGERSRTPVELEVMQEYFSALATSE